MGGEVPRSEVLKLESRGDAFLVEAGAGWSEVPKFRGSEVSRYSVRV